MEDFKKYFKLPLVQDEYAPFMVWDNDNNRAFDFLIDDRKEIRDIFKILSDEDAGIKGELTHDDGDVLLDGTPILMVRSWGRLTGTGGGLGLSSVKATEIQDQFCEWIIDNLKEK